MKREYSTPELEIEKFNLPVNSAITTTSEGGIDDGGDTGVDVEW